jgi:quinoprotein glucose dehydrogenase
VVILLLAAACVPSETPDGNDALAPGENWLRYAGDLAGTRRSRLDQIDTGNVGLLELAWTYGTPGAGRGGRGAPAAGAGAGNAPVDPDAPLSVSGGSVPIVVDGVMYLPAGSSVVAVESDTGNEIWTHTLEDGRPSSRGVSYWEGSGPLGPRLIFMADSEIHAIDAASGMPVGDFGEGGAVDVGVTYGGTPTVFNDIVLVGANNGELSQGGQPGNTRAYDVVTGEKLWEFEGIVQPGDPNFEGAWLDNGGEGGRAGVNHWGWYMTVDAEREIVYLALGSPAGNYWGGDRRGTNLYGNSVVAVDASTGHYLWHFQTVHHDLWDSDQPSSPSLLDIERDGETIPALALVGKTGYMFTLNRVTGEPLFGVEERPVPQGDAPGEWYSPTQPFPVAPPPLARVSFSEEDLVTGEDTTPEHAAACRELYEQHGGLTNQGPFTPWGFHEEGAPPASYIQFPGNGGTNWGGTAADPELGYVFAFTQDAAFTGWIEQKREGGNYGSGNGSPQPYDRGSIAGPGPYSGFSAMGMPCQKPPWGRLTAVDASTGEFAWQVTLGVSDELPEGRQDTGRGGSAGPIVTAGGLVFIGATSDARFRALDSRTGEERWVTRLPANATANPMTYMGPDGRQYVAIVAGGQVHTFALP